MLSEAIKHLMTPCAPHLKSMGYLRELIATEARFHRCRTAWQPHLGQTKSVIKNAIHQASGDQKAIVLGAGIMSDIPLHALSTHFKTVELIDISFLNSTKKKINKYNNITLRHEDITDLAATLYKNPQIPSPAVPQLPGLTDADLVISANILTQLPVIPVMYLQSKNPDLDQETLTAFERDIIQSHLGLLNKCAGVVCLVTEVERAFLDGNQILETEDLLSGIDLAKNGHSWFWDLAPKGEASPDYAIQNRLIGTFWKNN